MKILLLIFSLLSTNLLAIQVTQGKAKNTSYENDDEDYEEEEEYDDVESIFVLLCIINTLLLWPILKITSRRKLLVGIEGSAGWVHKDFIELGVSFGFNEFHQKYDERTVDTHHMSITGQSSETLRIMQTMLYGRYFLTISRQSDLSLFLG